MPAKKEATAGETGCRFPDTLGRGTRNSIDRQWCSPSDICLGSRARPGLVFVVLSKPWDLTYSPQSAVFVCVQKTQDRNTGLRLAVLGGCGRIGFLDSLHNQSRPRRPRARGLRVGLTAKSVCLSSSLLCPFPGDPMAFCLQEVEVSTSRTSSPSQPPVWGGKSHVGETGNGSRGHRIRGGYGQCPGGRKQWSRPLPGYPISSVEPEM